MTTWALVETGVVTQERGTLPASARRQDTSQWVMGLAAADQALREACGWYEVQPATRPPDDDTQTSDRSLTFTGTQVDETWTQRPWTTEEQDAQAADQAKLDAINQDRRNNSNYLANPDSAQVASLTDQMDNNTAATAPRSVRPTWEVGVFYKHNQQVDHLGKGYRCIQDHPSQADWSPTSPGILGVLWARTKDTDQWEAGVDYEIDDEVYYLIDRYKCIQAHPSQVGWEPPNVPALWELIPAT